MPNVNANLPMWSSAYWSQAERDTRQEEADRKDAERRLLEAVTLQKLVNEGRITEQQAQDAAATSRQQADIEFKKKALADSEEADWNRIMYQEGSRSKLQTNLLERELRDKELAYALREKENEIAGAGHYIRAYGTYGVPEADPAWPTLRRRLLGNEFNTAIPPGLTVPKPAGTKQPIANLRVNTGVMPRSDSSAPPVPAPTGPAPSPDAKLAPTSADMKLYEDWQNLQRKLNPSPK